MHSDAGPREPLHVRHRRVVIFFGVMLLLFFENGEDTWRRRPALRAGAHGIAAHVVVFSLPSSLVLMKLADQIPFSRGQTWLLIFHSFKNFFAQYSEEECRREPAHQNTGQSLERAEQSPLFQQHEVAVTDRGVGNTGKIERRLGVRQTVLPPEKQRPDGDFKEVNDNQEPRDAN
jgi:hypothetical protein